MGDYADQVINGEICELCGEPMDEEHGYPVTCAGCQKDEAED